MPLLCRFDNLKCFLTSRCKITTRGDSIHVKPGDMRGFDICESVMNWIVMRWTCVDGVVLAFDIHDKVTCHTIV